MLALWVRAAAVSAVAPPVDGVEHPALRTRYAKHFTLPSGEHAALISAAPLHWRDPAGVWEDIELAFHPDDSGGIWMNGLRSLVV